MEFFTYFFFHLIHKFILLFIFIYLDQIPQEATTEQMIAIINSLVMYVMVLKVVYQTFFVWMYGATLGRIAMKIKVISISDLEKPTLLFALSRASFRILSESLFYLGFVWAMLNPKRETWHDKVARTLVVNAG